MLILAILCTPSALQADKAKKPAPPVVNDPVEVPVVPDKNVIDEVTLRAHAEKDPVPLFFEVAVEQTSRQHRFTEFQHEFLLKGKILQAELEEQAVLRLEWKGEGKVTKIEGEGLASWSMATQQQQRFLELSLQPGHREFNFKILAETKRDLENPGEVYRLALPHLAKGDAAGFVSRINLHSGDGFQLKNVEAVGFSPLEMPKIAGAVCSHQALASASGGSLVFSVESNGIYVNGVNIQTIRLDGEVIEDEEKPYARINIDLSMDVREGGAHFPLIEGHHLALESLPENVHLVSDDLGKGIQRYSLKTEEAGQHLINFQFLVPVSKGLQRGFRFKVLSGHIIPVHLSGLDERIEFLEEEAFRPTLAGGKWNGFAPTGNELAVIWQPMAVRGTGELFFNTESQEEAILRAGLLEQKWTVSHKILQGEIKELEYELTGEGDILNVTAPNLLDWTIKGGEKEKAGANKRLLVVKLTRPEKEGLSVLISSQSALGAFPVKVQPLQISPTKAVRHTGFIKIQPAGAVQVEVGEAKGLTQLSPNQWPGQKPKPVKGAPPERSFVYRYPLPKRSYHLLADQIQPQVDVSQIVTYELGTSDRLIKANIELDISEAALREWDILIPADYSVVAVTGPEVGDYVVGTKKEGSSLALKVIFQKDISGRQLISLHLEKNEAAKAGAWILKPLTYPSAESIRGTVGIAVAPGFRAKETKIDKLSEKPLSHFPEKVTGLQQVYRIREAGWSASMTVQKLPQSVQSDLYHLHSLKDGIDYASVVVNYFVTGAPVEEWRLSLPEGAGNVSVEGRDIRTTRHKDGELEIKLQQPVLGSYTLLVTYEKEIGAQGGVLKAGQVSPLDVRNERGFVQVVSPVQVRHKMKASGQGLLKLDLLELPAEYRLLTSAPTLATYQYTARPFDLEMDVEWFDPADTLGQIVDFTEATSRVSRDGEVVTDLTYHLKSRAANILRVTLPDSVKIWEIEVNKESVNARSDGKDTLIPLPGGTGANEEIVITLRIGQEASKASTVPLALPVLSAPVLKLAWEVEADRGQSLSVKSGTLDGVRRSPSQNGFSWMANEGLPLTLLLLAALIVGLLLLKFGRQNSFLRRLGYLSLTAAVAFCVMSLLYAGVGNPISAPVQSSLSFSPKLIDAGEEISVVLRNDEQGKAQSSWLGWILMILGALLLLAGFTGVLGSKFKGNALWMKVAGAVLLILGCLLLGKGGFWFFLIYLILLLVSITPLLKTIGKSKEPDPPSDPPLDPPSETAPVATVPGSIFTQNETPQITPEKTTDERSQDAE